MLTADEPDLEPLEVYTFISGKRQLVTTRDRLRRARRSIRGAYMAYAKARDNVCALRAASTAPATGRDLRGNYKYLREKSAASDIRAAVFAAGRHGRCTLCGAGPAITLEHFLPKSAFPEFSVLPANLMPACSRCNTSKGAKYEAGGEPLYLHAYYDDISGLDRFLFANLDVDLDEGGFAISFHIDMPGTVPPSLRRRILSHFDRLNLDATYRAEAVIEVSDRAATIADQIEAGATPADVRAYLLGEAAGARRAKGHNYWRFAMLTAMADHPDVCDGAVRVP